jgi:signal transduction histidine kinase
MRWSLRNQILVPLIGIQAVAVTAIAVSTATLAARRNETQIIERLNGVIDALGQGNFPFTASVLSRMQQLSGAHFVAYTEEGRVTATSFPIAQTLPEGLRSVSLAARVSSLSQSPTIIVAGVRYFAVSVHSANRPAGSSLLVLYPETSWRQARWDAAVPPLMLGLGSLAIMVVVTGWIAHRISKRIRRVKQQVAVIAEGTFEELDLGSERDEVQDLSRSINLMCVQLKEMRGTIERSERTRLLGQLAAGLAHQLRNSLTGARMSVQLHARRYPSPDGDQSLNVALRQLTITEEQVKGLLSLGRVEQRPPELYDVSRIVHDVAFLVQPACQHGKVTFHEPIARGPIELFVDPLSLRSAVLNLTLNAIEAAGPGGDVSLAAVSNRDEVWIEVVDSGPGPSADLAGILCEAFVSSKPEGVGLGLAIAQQVAAEHGGRLSWDREQDHTCFRLALPKRNGTLL